MKITQTSQSSARHHSVSQYKGEGVVVYRHADIFNQQSMMNTCPSLPPQSGIGHGVFPVSYLTSALSEEDNISADKQNGYVVFGKVCDG